MAEKRAVVASIAFQREKSLKAVPKNLFKLSDPHSRTKPEKKIEFFVIFAKTHFLS
jgi:hypothetical protein